MHYPMLDVEGIQMDTIRLLAVDPKITMDDLNTMNEKEVGQKIYEAARAYYKRKNTLIAETTLEGLKNIREKHAKVERVEIGFTDGTRRVRVVVDLDRAIANNGAEVVKELEKSVMLGMIDDNWKDHLREMDELRTSVQNAVFEQKDPLVVYKFEAYELFQQVLKKVNEEVISLIFKSGLEVAQHARQEEKRDDFSKMKTKHDEVKKATASPTRRPDQRGPAGVSANRSNQEERPLSRRERRAQEKSKGKRR